MVKYLPSDASSEDDRGVERYVPLSSSWTVASPAGYFIRVSQELGA
jgi:hypothetical protein